MLLECCDLCLLLEYAFTLNRFLLVLVDSWLRSLSFRADALIESEARLVDRGELFDGRCSLCSCLIVDNWSSSVLSESRIYVGFLSVWSADGGIMCCFFVGKNWLCDRLRLSCCIVLDGGKGRIVYVGPLCPSSSEDLLVESGFKFDE